MDNLSDKKADLAGPGIGEEMCARKNIHVLE